MSRKVYVWLLLPYHPVNQPCRQSAAAEGTPRIGYFSNSDAATGAGRADAVRQALSEVGYVEGENILIEYRYADGKIDRAPKLSSELTRLNVDLFVVAGGARRPQAAKNATNNSDHHDRHRADPVGLASWKVLPVPAATSPALPILIEI